MTLLLEDKMEQHSTRHEPGMSRHEEHIVRRLANETDCPEHEARATYVDERDRLARGARVKNYVSIIAARHARERLKHKSR